MKRRRVTGLLMAAVLAVSSCPGGFSAAAAEPDALMEMGEVSGIPEEIEPVSDADAVLPDEAAEDAEPSDGMTEDLITEMELPDEVIEETAAELFDDPDGFSDDGIFEEEIPEGEEAPALGDAYDVVVRVEPADYGNIVTYQGRCKEFETGTAADGTLIDPFSVEPANQDKLIFSHWELNGTTLAAGENCEVSEEEYYFTPDLVKLDPTLLTSDRNVLKAVFIPNPHGEISMDSFWYQAGEGGMLEENGSGCLQKEITNYIAYDSIYSGYDVISSCILAVPDEGYQFFRWVDAMGNTISTEAEISQLDAKLNGEYTSPFITDYIDSPYTAEFRKMGTEVISMVTVTCEPDNWGSVAKVKEADDESYVHWSRPMPEKEAFTMPVIKDGSFPFTGLLPTVGNIDKVAFSHWELNGQELVDGENCTYKGKLLTNIDVSLLTGENDVLTAVFKPYGEMVQDPIFFYASEGGHLETDDDGISYNVVRNYAAMFEYMFASYDNVHNYVKAVAHEGYAFAGWKDKNGNIVSTDPLISDLDACTYDETNVQYYDYNNEFMKCWEDAPFTAVFDKLEDDTTDDTILVTTEPYGWGKIYYTRPDGVQGEASRIEGFPIAKDGKLFSTLAPVLAITGSPDRMFFSHWTLNGKKLAPGTDCTYIYDMDNEPVGLEAVNPALLTGNDILTAVFVKSAYDDMVLDSIRFRASEGGTLKAEDWSEPYDELHCYVAITEPKWKGYNTLYSRITAVPDKGWRFIRWEDKNGEVISTDALVDDLKMMDDQDSYASAFIRSYQSSPFTAVFEELGTLTIKVSANGAEIPDTASFTVTGPEGYEKQLAYSAFTDGAYTLEDLVPGTYTVKEDEASAALDSFELAVSYPENGEALIAKEALKASVSIENTYTEKTISGSTGDDMPSEEAALKALDDQILNIPTEESPDALYGKLYFRVMGVGKHAIKLRWRKINGATGYVLYGGPCKGRFQRLGMVTTNRCTVNKLKKGTYYKFKLVAVKQTGKGLGVEMISKVVHEVTSGGKLGNPRGISFSGKKKVTLKKGKSARINAKPVLPAGLKIRVHRKLCFESSNPAVATVTKKGKIKAVGKGKATIFVYAQNGICRKVKVVVR